jgi:hypothetical protein
MSGPKIYLSSSDKEGNNNSISIGNRNPYWVVCFVRFKEPCAMQAGDKSKVFETKEPLIVENDCISVTVSNPKNSFSKTCTLVMKPGEIWYPNAVSPGDWVFVWMTEDRLSSEKILNSLMQRGGTTPSIKEGTNLNGWDSGLKFFGRVMNLNNSQSVSSNGVIGLNQSINCQSFVEMANSVYYTYIAKSLLTMDNPENEIAGSNLLVTKNLASIRGDPNSQTNGMDKALTNIADKFLGYAKDTTGFSSPEEIIAIMFILIMGIEKENSVVNVVSGLKGSFGDAIGVPSLVASILSRKNKNKLWQMYNVVLGLQSYTAKKNSAAALFPDLDETSASQSDNAVFYRTKTKTKGVVPLQIPPIWDNRTLWEVMNSFLNPVVNEMYTCLRINKHGEIVPTLVVREIPYSTGLYDYLNGKATQFTIDESDEKQKALQKTLEKQKESLDKSYENAEDKAKADKLKVEEQHTGASNKQRTFYKNLPRWIIPKEKVLSINLNISEQARINFVQVWGRSDSAEFTFGGGWDQEAFKAVQFLNKNYVADEADIARSGLRADITETPFDLPSSGGGSMTNMLARMRADWYFNGHLKPSGTITLMGIQEPICEGDNIQYQGIVYHIVNVTHQCSIAADGRKSFTTTLQIENGMTAEGLDAPRMNKSLYPKYFGEMRDQVNDIFGLKGKTDIQNTGERKNRDSAGEPINPPPPKRGKKK